MANNQTNGDSANSPQPLTLHQRFRDRLHEIIFEADTLLGVIFDVLLLCAIVTSIVVVCLETLPEFGRANEGAPEGTVGKYEGVLKDISWFFTILFTIEYLLRIYCVRKPWNYILSFWGIVDLLSFLPDYFLQTARINSRGFSVLRSLRLLRVFRILRLGWFQSEADDLGNAVWRARAKIVVFLTTVMIIVTVMGTLMYELEHALKPNECQFHSIPEGIYWAIVTMTTVGFGDIVPVTTPGKILSAILILIGYSLIIVPTGFVSAEFLDRKFKREFTTRSCPSCVTEGHDKDAVHCKYCGETL